MENNKRERITRSDLDNYSVEKLRQNLFFDVIVELAKKLSDQELRAETKKETDPKKLI